MIPGSANPLLLKSAAAASYQIERSLRFNSSDSGFCSRTPASAGNRRTWTWAGWVKRSGLSSTQRIFSSSNSGNTEGFYCELVSGDTLSLYDYSDPTVFWQKTTSQVFRDASAWFHLQVAFDSTNATAGDRVKIYVNGVLVTAFGTSTNPSLNYDSYWNAARVHAIGRTGDANAGYFSGYLADIHFIDGQALTPSSFIEVSATTGQLIPKAYTGSYTGNSFWLKFSDNSAATATTLGKDSFLLGNNWTPNNLSVTAGAGNDSLVDTPTSYGTDDGLGGSVRGNYCTFNPLVRSGSPTLSNGNLTATGSGTVEHTTFGLSSGKWYAEITATSLAGSANLGVAIYSQSALGVENGATSYGYFSNGQKYANGSLSNYGNSFAQGDVIGIALDLDAGKIWFSKNGVFQNSGSPTGGTNEAFSGLTGNTWFISTQGGSGSHTVDFNGGQRPFAYTAPSGFKALCDTNLPAPVIAKSSTVMDVKLYTGNGSTQTISGLGFSPDLAWIKSRSSAYDNILFDTVRTATKQLIANSTGAEATYASSLTAFNSDGFSVGSDAVINNNASTYAAWCWDAGSSTVTNTQGSITSSVRANASAGFSIVTYTGNATAGATVGHGLGVAPALIINKQRSGTNNWWTYHASLGATKYLVLDATNAVSTANTVWNDTAPTSTVFSIGVTGVTNTNSATYVSYCFAPVVGYSSFGSYTGNGSTDGPFVFCGFRPRWILVKRTDGVIQWTILDTARSPSNVADQRLFPNLSQAETVNGDGNTDLLSNGFKPRNIDSAFNANGGTYIYAAFAESPFAYSRAR